MVPVAIVQKPNSTAATTTNDQGLQLRMRLNMNPHDKESHEALVKILRRKNAFRAELEE